MELEFWEWVKAINKEIKKRTIVAGKNITIEQHDDKTIINSGYDLGGGGGGQTTYVCRIISHLGNGVYQVEVHPKGKDSSDGVFQAVATLINQPFDGALLSGTWVICVEGQITTV